MLAKKYFAPDSKPVLIRLKNEFALILLFKLLKFKNIFHESEIVLVSFRFNSHPLSCSNKH